MKIGRHLLCGVALYVACRFFTDSIPHAIGGGLFLVGALYFSPLNED